MRTPPHARLLIAMAPLLLLSGCGGSEPVARPRMGGSAGEGQVQSAALLRSVAEQLRSLPEAAQVELRPPAIVLDARNSTDGGDVMARVIPTPGAPDSAVNYLTVDSKNAGFQRPGVDVRTGDIVKYFLIYDRETRERIEATGESDLVNMASIDLPVGQVLGPQELRIARPLAQPVDFPVRMEVWRILDDRMEAIDRALALYASEGEPALAWEPTPDGTTMAQLLERLNQWLRSRKRPEGWAPTKLLATLPKELRDAVQLRDLASEEALSAAVMPHHEGHALQAAAWTRDIASWAAGDSPEPLEQARALFAWCVRNVSLTDSPRVAGYQPWEALLHGRGLVAHRAWVFAQLCAQRRIPVAVVMLPPTASGDADKDAGPGGEPWLWCAVLHAGELYLFDPRLGLEVPDGEGVATLAGVRQDDALLRALDLEGAPYPPTAKLAERARVSVVADPFALSWRAAELEAQLSGRDAMALAVDADALAARLAKAAGGEATLWEMPFATLRRRVLVASSDAEAPRSLRNAEAVDFRPYAWRPRLWKARMLHFRGTLETAETAASKGALFDPVDDHAAALREYMDPSIRISDSILATVESDVKTRIYLRAKADATYWLGVLQHERGAHVQARKWFSNESLTGPDGEHRTDGVRFNLALTLEALGDAEGAASLLREDQSPQRHGNLLRAARIERRAKPPAKPAST